jgi:hypothetical protein
MLILWLVRMPTAPGYQSMSAALKFEKLAIGAMKKARHSLLMSDRHSQTADYS